MSDLVVGTHDVLRLIAGRLVSDFQAYLRQIEQEAHADPGSISAAQTTRNPAGLRPKFISVFEKGELALEEMPALMLSAVGIPRTTYKQTTARHPAIDDDPDGEQFERLYRLRLNGYVMNQDYKSVEESRNRFELAASRTLMNARGLAPNAFIDKNSWVVSLSDISPSGGKDLSSFMSGFSAQLAVNVTETLTTTALGVADTILVETYHLDDES